jgi:hypothetical protein
VEDLPNLSAELDEFSGDVFLSWTAGWMRADGNCDGVITVQDWTPIGTNYGKSCKQHFAALRADYDGDGRVVLNDARIIGQHFSQGVSHYELRLGDDDSSLATAKIYAQPNWAERTIVSLPYDEFGDPTTSIDFWRERISNADLKNVDKDADMQAKIFITPYLGMQAGESSSLIIPVSTLIVPTPQLLVTSAVIALRDVKSGTETLFDWPDGPIDVLPGADYELSLHSIAGQYSSYWGAGNFEDAESLPADMSEAMYDAALEQIRARALWNVGHAGAPGYRHGGDWITFSSAAPLQGDPGPGRVGSDFDPESSGELSEGRLSFSISAGEFDGEGLFTGTVPKEVKLELRFDVQEEPLAPALGMRIYPAHIGEQDKSQQQEALIRLLASYPINWGSSGAPPQLSGCQLELWQGRGPSGAYNKLSSSQFTYRASASLDALQAGEFSIDTSGPRALLLLRLPQLQPAYDKYYLLRFSDGQHWGSLNIGGDSLAELDSGVLTAGDSGV